MPGSMTTTSSALAAAAVIVAGCASPYEPDRTQYLHRFSRPAADAARCFARNAEAHSSALVADISGGELQPYDVVVRVKNGATYATARISGAGAGAQGVIDLNVQASQGNRQLLQELVAGC